MFHIAVNLIKRLLAQISDQTLVFIHVKFIIKIFGFNKRKAYGKDSKDDKTHTKPNS